MRSILKYINGFSIDVALGAVVFSNSLSFYFGVSLPFSFSVLLFCAVWVIYTLDHLLDAKNVGHNPVSFRHNLHVLYRKQLIVFVGVAFLVSLFTLFYVDEVLIWVGSFFSISILLYLLFNYKYKIRVKELIVATGYTIGVLLGLFVVVSFNITLGHLIIAFQILLIAFLNLLVFAFIEFDQDSTAGFSSWVTLNGKKATAKTITVLITLFFLGQALLILQNLYSVTDTLQAVFFVMVLCLGVIFNQSDRLTSGSLYRLLGDGVFFLPGLLYIFR
jgi:hypothetical protein